MVHAVWFKLIQVLSCFLSFDETVLALNEHTLNCACVYACARNMYLIPQFRSEYLRTEPNLLVVQSISMTQLRI